MRTTGLILILLCATACDRRLTAITKIQQDVAVEQARLAPEIRALQAALADHPVFVATGTRSDAAPFLNPLVPWGRSSSAALSLPREVVDALAGPDWVVHSEKVDTAALDFSWMQRLSSFDHWDFARDPRWSGGRPFSFMHAQAPDWFVLTRWAKLRLLDGHRRGALPAATRDVEALVRVMATTESRDALELAADMLRYRVDGPEPDPVEDARVAQYMKGQHSLRTFVSNPDEVRQRLAATDTPGFCTFMTEVLWRSFYYRPHAEKLTSIIAANYAAYDALIADPKVRCRWPLLREAWSERGKNGRFLDPFTDKAEGRPVSAQGQEIIEYFHPPAGREPGTAPL